MHPTQNRPLYVEGAKTNMGIVLGRKRLTSYENKIRDIFKAWPSVEWVECSLPMQQHFPSSLTFILQLERGGGRSVGGGSSQGCDVPNRWWRAQHSPWQMSCIFGAEAQKPGSRNKKRLGPFWKMNVKQFFVDHVVLGAQAFIHSLAKAFVWKWKFWAEL